MFKNIQKNLLINNPLLWNSKIIPFACLTIVFHILFFAIGYINGEIDFTRNDNYYDYGADNAIIIFVSVVITILIFIVWLVLYSRNNAFKSFYPKTNSSLFKEWFYIFIFCLLNSSYAVSFLYAKDVRQRNYLTQEEFNKRLDIISLTSVFVDGPFTEDSYTTVEKSGEYVRVERKTFTYKGKEYPLKSLINKKPITFSSFNYEKDTLNEIKIKRWLTENKKDSVQWLFKEFMNIAKQHHLKSNLTPEKWLELVYDYPSFSSYEIIGNQYRDKSADAATYPVDTYPTEESAVVENQNVYSEYYVPFNPLKNSYEKISNAWDNPTVEIQFLISFLYLGLGLSLFVFSFKVTSGKNWLIAMVSLGLIGIILGVFSAFVGGYTFVVCYFLILVGLLVNFFFVINSKTSKGISGITLNQIIWLLPSVLPVLYFVVLDTMKHSSRYYDSYSKELDYPAITWLTEHASELIVANIGFVIIVLYFFSALIKKWKGIAEG